MNKANRKPRGIKEVSYNSQMQTSNLSIRIAPEYGNRSSIEGGQGTQMKTTDDLMQPSQSVGGATNLTTNVSVDYGITPDDLAGGSIRFPKISKSHIRGSKGINGGLSTSQARTSHEFYDMPRSQTSAVSPIPQSVNNLITGIGQSTFKKKMSDAESMNIKIMHSKYNNGNQSNQELSSGASLVRFGRGKTQAPSVSPIRTGQGESAKLLQKQMTAALDQNQQMPHTSNNKLNPRILESWINETLQDAEYLDIPGVLLQPSHKNPVSRYNIDRLTLTNCGIPSETVDRIYRSLFVYSVGFYELIKKCIAHATGNKYTVVTNIWKVYCILLEFCCKTDYRMLVSEISKQNESEKETLKKDFESKLSELIDNEKVLKQNMESLQRHIEVLEKDRTNERALRLKLEEEYMQNQNSHEEEVQLRLKFESKLNNMHSVHRDLESRYERALTEIQSLQAQNECYLDELFQVKNEVAATRTAKAESEAQLEYQNENILSMKRDLELKIRIIQEQENRLDETREECDLTKYKLQEIQKEQADILLKLNMNQTQVEGMVNEKGHLEMSVTEARSMRDIYEAKCNEFKDRLERLRNEHQISEREIAGFEEIRKEREERIESLKAENKKLKEKLLTTDQELDELKNGYEKLQVENAQFRIDLDDSVEKLRITNKVRNETEGELGDKIDKCKALLTQLEDSTFLVERYKRDLDTLERKISDLDRNIAQLEISKAEAHRQLDINKKQLSEKISHITQILSEERKAKEDWVEKYDEEARAHTETTTENIRLRNDFKDMELKLQDIELKYFALKKNSEGFEKNSHTLQNEYNLMQTKLENAERELNTKGEILKQYEDQRRNMHARVKDEVNKYRLRFEANYQADEMYYEDVHSLAAQYYQELIVLRRKNKTQQLLLKDLEVKTKFMERRYKDVKGKHEGIADHYEELMMKLDESSFLSDKYYHDWVTSQQMLHKENALRENYERANESLNAKLKQFNMLNTKLLQAEKQIQDMKSIPTNTQEIQTDDMEIDNKEQQTSIDYGQPSRQSIAGKGAIAGSGAMGSASSQQRKSIISNQNQLDSRDSKLRQASQNKIRQQQNPKAQVANQEVNSARRNSNLSSGQNPSKSRHQSQASDRGPVAPEQASPTPYSNAKASQATDRTGITGQQRSGMTPYTDATSNQYGYATHAAGIVSQPSEINNFANSQYVNTPQERDAVLKNEMSFNPLESRGQIDLVTMGGVPGGMYGSSHSQFRPNEDGNPPNFPTQPYSQQSVATPSQPSQNNSFNLAPNQDQTQTYHSQNYHTKPLSTIQGAAASVNEQASSDVSGSFNMQPGSQQQPRVYQISQNDSRDQAVTPQPITNTSVIQVNQGKRAVHHQHLDSFGTQNPPPGPRVITDQSLPSAAPSAPSQHPSQISMYQAEIMHIDQSNPAYVKNVNNSVGGPKSSMGQFSNLPPTISQNQLNPDMNFSSGQLTNIDKNTKGSNNTLDQGKDSDHNLKVMRSRYDEQTTAIPKVKVVNNRQENDQVQQSNNREVKGKPSIKNLIKLSAQRDN